MVEVRATASRIRDEPSGRFYWQGREEVTEDTANVFGDENYVPLALSDNGVLVFEAEVSFCFSDIADDDPSDRSEIYRFQLWAWSSREDVPARLSRDWEDFNGDEPPGREYGWDQLLFEAVARIRRAHFDRQAFQPISVGAPKLVE